MASGTPNWYYDNDLDIQDRDWHTINFFAGPNEDQRGLLFMRVDDSNDNTTIIGISPEHAKKIRDHLEHWLKWCEERGLL